MIDVLRRRSAAAVWLAALLGLVLVLGATSATAGAQQTLRASGKAQAAEHGKPGADAKAKAKQKAKAKAKKAKQKAKARAKARARARAEARARARAAAAAQASAQAQAQVQAPGAAGQTAGSTATAVANGSGSAGTPAAGPAEPAAETRPPLGAGLPSIGGCVRAVRFDAGSFPATPDIDNPLLPFVPGTQLVLQGRSNVTGALVDHTVTSPSRTWSRR
jgi:hypothetical protein